MSLKRFVIESIVTIVTYWLIGLTVIIIVNHMGV